MNMFQNQHLANYVGQKDPNDKIIMNPQPRLSSQSQMQASQHRAQSQGKLQSGPQSSSQITKSGFRSDTNSPSSHLKASQTNSAFDQNGDYSPLYFMAVGNRLNMATYAKKESKNPPAVLQPGFLTDAQQKAQKARNLQEQEKQLAQSFKAGLVKKGSKDTHNKKESLNSDLFPFGKKKKTSSKNGPGLQRRHTFKQTTGRNLDQQRMTFMGSDQRIPESISEAHGKKQTVFNNNEHPNENFQNRESNGSDMQARPRPTSLYKASAKQSQSRESQPVDDSNEQEESKNNLNLTSHRLNSPSAEEQLTLEQAKSSEYVGPNKVNAVHQRPQNVQQEKQLASDRDCEDEDYADDPQSYGLIVNQTPALKQIGNKIIAKLSFHQTKQGDQQRVEQNLSSLTRYGGDDERFATTSVVTQPDYINGNTKANSSINQPQTLRQQPTPLTTKQSNRTPTPPNLTVEGIAAGTTTAQVFQQVNTSPSKNAEGGIITTHVSQPDDSPPRSKKNSTTVLKILNSNITITEQTPQNQMKPPPQGESFSARNDDYQMQRGTSLSRSPQKGAVIASQREITVSGQPQNIMIEEGMHPSLAEETVKVSSTSPTDFSNLEHKQSLALQGSLGSTKINNSLTNNNRQQWQQKQTNIFHQSGQRIQKIGGPTGLKGSKLPRNSQFVKMQGFLKKRNQEISERMLMAQHQEMQNSVLNSETAATGMAIGAVESSFSGFHGAKLTTKGQQKQSIHVQERPMTQEMLSLMEKSLQEKCETAEEGTIREILREDTQESQLEPQITSQIKSNIPTELRSWASSQDKEDLMQQEAMILEQTMSAHLKDIENDGTIQIATPKNAELQEIQNQINAPQFPSATPSFEQITSDRMNIQELTLQSQNPKDREIVTRGRADVVELASNVQKEATDPAQGDKFKSGYAQDADPMSEDTNGDKSSQQQNNQADKHEITVNTRIDYTTNGHVGSKNNSPTVRVLSSKQAQFQSKNNYQRNAHSQNQKYRLPRNELGAGGHLVVGSQGLTSKQASSVFFKEEDMQLLFEKAEPPVQQVIEKILLDDLDHFQGFAYAPQAAQKQRVTTTTVNSPAQRQGDHVKYEFIERLLKQSDKTLNGHTLKEVSNLYQILIERNHHLSKPTPALQARNMALNHSPQHGHIQPKHTRNVADKAAESMKILGFQTSGSGMPRTFAARKNTETVQSKLKDVKKGKLRASRASHQGDLSSSMNLGAIDSSPMAWKNKAASGRLIGESSASNSQCHLQMTRPKWSVALEDYGIMESTVNDGFENSQRIEIDGKKINLQNSDGMVTDEMESPKSGQFKKKQSDQQRPSWKQLINNKTLNLDQQLSFKSQRSNDLTSKKQSVRTNALREQTEEGSSPSSLKKDSQRKNNKYQRVLLSHARKDLLYSSPEAEQHSDVDNKQTHIYDAESTFDNRQMKASSSATPEEQAIIAQRNTQINLTFFRQKADIEKSMSAAENNQGLSQTMGIVSNAVDQNEDLMQLQMARSAYLSFRANSFNQNKQVVGNTTKNYKERQKFIEQLFQPSNASQIEAMSSQILGMYETKLLAAVPQQLDATNQPLSTKHLQNNFAGATQQDYEDQNELVKSRQSSLKAASNGSSKNGHTAQNKVGNNAQDDFDPENIHTPLNIQEMDGIEHSMKSRQKSSTSRNSSSKKSKGGTASHMQIINEPSSIANYSRREEMTSKKQSQNQVEKKNVMRHELKVPKAGQLEAVKASRIRQLSSNQVSGFKIRNTSQNTYGTNNEVEESPKVQQVYGLENNQKVSQRKRLDQNNKSNQDLVDFLKKPRNKSQLNVFENDDSQDAKEMQEEELELNVSREEDMEEVGTQNMISRPNLVASHHNIMNHLHSPSAIKKKIEEQNSGMQGVSQQDINFKDHQSSGCANYQDLEDSFTAKNIPRNELKSHHSSHSVTSVGSGSQNQQKNRGKIQVRQLYKQERQSQSTFTQNKHKESSIQSKNHPARDLMTRSKTQMAAAQQMKNKLVLQNSSFMRASQMSKKEMNKTTNFERLSGLISQSYSNERKARLIEHYKKIKQQQREERVNSDWRRATPNISVGSTFYKDLFDLRNKVKDQSMMSVLDTTLQPGINNTVFDPAFIKSAEQDRNQEMLLNSQMMALYQSQQQPQIGNLLSRDSKKNKRESFFVSRSAVTPCSKLLISQLLSQVDGQAHKTGERKTGVQPLKQSCLVQHILEEWTSMTRGQLVNFNYFCTYSDNIIVDRDLSSPDANKTEAYSVILYGNQTPLSICCNQLICFQFTKSSKSINIFCLEPRCQKKKIESRPLASQIYHTIFMTAQGGQQIQKEGEEGRSSSPKDQRVIFHKTSQSTDLPTDTMHRRAASLVSSSVKHQKEMQGSALRMQVLLASQQIQQHQDNRIGRKNKSTSAASSSNAVNKSNKIVQQFVRSKTSLKQQKKSSNVFTPNEPNSPAGLCGRYHGHADNKVSIQSKEHQINLVMGGAIEPQPKTASGLFPKSKQSAKSSLDDRRDSQQAQKAQKQKTGSGIIHVSMLLNKSKAAAANVDTGSIRSTNRNSNKEATDSKNPTRQQTLHAPSAHNISFNGVGGAQNNMQSPSLGDEYIKTDEAASAVSDIASPGQAKNGGASISQLRSNAK